MSSSLCYFLVVHYCKRGQHCALMSLCFYIYLRKFIDFAWEHRAELRQCWLFGNQWLFHCCELTLRSRESTHATCCTVNALHSALLLLCLSLHPQCKMKLFIEDKNDFSNVIIKRMYSVWPLGWIIWENIQWLLSLGSENGAVTAVSCYIYLTKSKGIKLPKNPHWVCVGSHLFVFAR